MQKMKLQKIRGYKDLLVLDIDNTLTKSQLMTPINHKNPAPRQQLIIYVKQIESKGSKVIFLTARDFRLKQQTLDWLKKVGLSTASKDTLLLVPSARHKISILKEFINTNHKVTYYDDLSYNHENGVVKVYQDVINDIKKMNLTYYDVSHINTYV